jgi:hypothetical protein
MRPNGEERKQTERDRNWVKYRTSKGDKREPQSEPIGETSRPFSHAQAFSKAI